MREREEGKVRLAVIVALAFISLMAATASAQVTTVSIGDASAAHSNTTIIPLIINISSADAPAGLGAVEINLTYDPSVCVVTSVTNWTFDSFTSSHLYTNTSGYVRMVAYQTGVIGVGPGLVKFADVELKAVGNTGVSGLNLLVKTLRNNTGALVSYTTENGSFTILAEIFNTGSGTYPSIFGTHNGTIKLNKTIIVSTLYTYPCSGTGGHTEYVRIWNNSDWNATARWDGYGGDWHNITFNNSFTLREGENYNYTIKTGSYPQIIHEKEFDATGGTITCTEFVDANGKRYDDWIPAIRLE